MQRAEFAVPTPIKIKMSPIIFTISHCSFRYFGNSCNLKESLRRPLLYSKWFTMNYMPVERDELKDYIQARLKGFYEEELDVQLVLFDQMLDHVLRIDRIYRQPQGHLLLIGTAGAGKTTLSRFVAWLNGLSVFQVIKMVLNVYQKKIASPAIRERERLHLSEPTIFFSFFSFGSHKSR